MPIRVAINGYGRIGRNILRAFYERANRPDIQIVAINDLGDVETNAHLTRYDTTHGKFQGTVEVSGSDLVINGDKIRVVAERDPKKLPWRELNIDVVYECTGLFTSKEKAGAHIEAGAKKVIISAPATDVDATIVFGVNDHVLKQSDTIISNASCTTNCLAPLVKPLNDKLGIVSGLMNTVHSYTNDQVLIDVFHKDLHRARSATHSMIPTKTGAALAVGLVMPELNGKLDGFSIRVPTINVSVVDFTFVAKRETTVEEVNQILRDAAASGPLKGVLEINDLPLVSIDFNHNPASSIVDTAHTKVAGTLVKVLSWYDNEWGFSNRMLDVTGALMKATKDQKAKAAV
ncbi:MAG: type I glyceraldehyde-3-phosphate dehydrogenase [Gammaproteobacteria bacterium]|nr:type I glyceraldehyde-3-phosphate dehydrogenase [Gammaproteobacteria bacterium]